MAKMCRLIWKICKLYTNPNSSGQYVRCPLYLLKSTNIIRPMHTMMILSILRSNCNMMRLILESNRFKSHINCKQIWHREMRWGECVGCIWAHLNAPVKSFPSDCYFNRIIFVVKCINAANETDITCYFMVSNKAWISWVWDGVKKATFYFDGLEIFKTI